MKITNLFRWLRRREPRRDVAAIRAKTNNARKVLADTDAMLASRERS